ncbi:hypothetical protein [Streptomyces sp. NPDC016845]|uniref:hypothetical protein n=1 Tax=Streptomyces sp. NPDC016845 TaxID=3364972 RepID=UPI00379FD8E6
MARTLLPVVALLGASMVAAPPAVAAATPAGCGELSHGNLCINGGRLGRHATYTWTVHYSRSADGQITVLLGDQRKNGRMTALPNYYGKARTSRVSGHAERSQKHSVDAGDCIRGVMEYRNKMYVTKWRCP